MQLRARGLRGIEPLPAKDGISLVAGAVRASATATHCSMKAHFVPGVKTQVVVQMALRTNYTTITGLRQGLHTVDAGGAYNFAD